MATKKTTPTKKTPVKKAPAKKAAKAKPVPPAAEVGNRYNPLVMVQEFLKFEASAGIILLFFAVLAMIVANSSLGHTYHHFLHEVNLTIKIGEFGLDKHIIHWINDGLMALFFFLVGLEIKREMLEGSLSSFKKALLPGVAAVGGMILPGIIYVLFNGVDPATGMWHLGQEKIAGWAVPAATDIAFAMGMMALLGTRVPLALKVFLLALAIFDDLGAILIIALFYTDHLSLINLAYAAGFVAVLFGLNRMRVNQGTMYIIVGICLWFCVLKSGVHATLAGVITALFVPLNIVGERRSLLRQLEHDLHPFVAYVVLPLFAFANAGVSLEGISGEVFFQSITLGVMLGLFLGKQIGVFGFTWLAHTLKIAQLPKGITWVQVWGMSALAGIGFTMSLFVSSLGFRSNDLYMAEAKLGILMGSVVSALCGLFLLYIFGDKSALKSKGKK